jgi:ADP-heptose:LPS heptosyltransferase
MAVTYGRQGWSGLKPASHAGCEEITRIIVVRVCAVGDFVFNLPALIALQKLLPNARFTLVGNASTMNLAKTFVTVDGVHSIDLQPWARLFYEPLPCLKFDMAIVWMKDPVVANNLRNSGIPNVMKADPFPMFGHASDHLLRTLGLPRPELPDLWIPDSQKIFLHPGSGSAKKNWPHFSGLQARLANSLPIPQNLPLPELMKEISHCSLFIGNDSGITHLAAYTGCPTVALFGQTDPRIWGPVGRRARVVWKSNLDDISVDDVLLSVHGTHTRTRING